MSVAEVLQQLPQIEALCQKLYLTQVMGDSYVNQALRIYLSLHYHSISLLVASKASLNSIDGTFDPLDTCMEETGIAMLSHKIYRQALSTSDFV